MVFHNVLQNSDEWINLRIGKATASNFPLFMARMGFSFGEPAQIYAWQLACERFHGRKIRSEFTNEHMQRGHELEPIARALYEDRYFTMVANGGFFDCGEYGDSPDGLVGDDGAIEIKSVGLKTHVATFKRDDYDPAYKWQLIGHLDCTGREWVDFVSYCPDFPDHKQLLVHRLYREDYGQEIAMLRERREQFLDMVRAFQHSLE